MPGGPVMETRPGFPPEDVGMKRQMPDRPDLFDKRPRMGNVPNVHAALLPDNIRHEMNLLLTQIHSGLPLTDRMNLDELRLANPILFDQMRSTVEERLGLLGPPGAKSAAIPRPQPLPTHEPISTVAPIVQRAEESSTLVKAFVGESVVNLDLIRAQTLTDRLRRFAGLPKQEQMNHASKLALRRLETLLSGAQQQVSLPSIIRHGTALPFLQNENLC